jgi:hypothetical protein
METDDANAHVGDADGTAPGLMDAADAPDFIRAGPAAYMAMMLMVALEGWYALGLGGTQAPPNA